MNFYTLKYINLFNIVFLVIIFVLLMLFSSCASVQYGDFSYTRIGDQNIDLAITRDGATFHLIQFSDAQALEEFLKALVNVTGRLP